MSDMAWEVLGSEEILNDEWIRMRADRCRMPGGTIVHPYYVLDFSDWVNVVALTGADDVVLVRQYRHGIGRTIVELPCGRIDKGESAEQAIRRELMEETGFEAGELTQMATLSPNAATQSNFSHYFLARGARRVAEPAPDPTEEIETVLMPLRQVLRLASEGSFLQATHVCALFLAQSHLKL